MRKWESIRNYICPLNPEQTINTTERFLVHAVVWLNVNGMRTASEINKTKEMDARLTFSLHTYSEEVFNLNKNIPLEGS